MRPPYQLSAFVAVLLRIVAALEMPVVYLLLAWSIGYQLWWIVRELCGANFFGK